MEATEIWLNRRIIRYPWTAKQTNKEVLKRANDRKRLIKTEYKLANADLLDL